MVIAWLLLAPAVLFMILLMAAWLESHIVAPGERARAIGDLLRNRIEADDVEREVALLLRPLDSPRRARR